jgi:hypothetical protein
LWLALQIKGFDQRTHRIAWRYWDEGIDLVEVRSVGPLGDAVGCTSISFDAKVATAPTWFRAAGALPQKEGRPRPHYWHCGPLKLALTKTLSQPWFTPLPRPLGQVGPMGLHEAGLKQVLRSDVHDRPDIWFVREDGSNLEQVVDDLGRVAETIGLPFLARMHDAATIAQMVADGELSTSRGSPMALKVSQAAAARLGV